MPTTPIDETKEQKFFSADPVRTYLHEIGGIPLLTREQELFYAQQVQKMMALLAQKQELEQELERPPTQSEWAERAGISVEQLNQALRQGERAKRQMIEANLRLVVAIAKKYQHRNLEFLDLIQEGSLGLKRGVEKFDPNLGYKFSTYAYWWIRQSITRAISQQSRTIRLPIHIIEKLNKIKKARARLSSLLGRTATESEIATDLGISPAQIREYFKMARPLMSLDVRIGDNQDTELSELIKDDGATPEEYTTFESMRHDVQNLLAELTPLERKVIEMRFGLNNGQGMSLASIGKKLNLSRERVRQLEYKAIGHLRKKNPVFLREYIAS